MSDDETFIARWSRRKRGASTAARHQPKAEKTDDAAGLEAPVTALAAGETRPSFDPASLPPLESIGTGSDVKAFLAAGVPAELTRAALRRAWSTDPAIRDFIGLSENAWDFNAPGGVPGFGPIGAEDVRRLLAQAIGEPELVDPARPAATMPSTGLASDAGATERGIGMDPAQGLLEHDHNTDAAHADPPPPGTVDIAMQHEVAASEYHSSLPRRGHGGALPE